MQVVEPTAPIRDTSEEPVFALLIGGEPFTEHARNISFSYSEEAGGSELTFETKEPVSELAGQRVTLRLGYGEHIPYFSGKLKNLRTPSLPFRFPQAKALGPFAELATQHFGEETIYQNVPIGTALYDIHKRAGFPRGTIEILKQNSFFIDEAIFAEENTLLEGSKALMESADFVGSDMPGLYGRRLALPRPESGEQGKAKRRFTPEDTPHNGLTIEPAEEVAYSKVVVFSREEAGGYSIRASAPVRTEGRPAPRNRILYITDFVGSQQEANETARKRARQVSSGVQWKLSGIPIDPSLEKYDQIETERYVERREGRFRETHSLSIGKGLSGTVADWTMDLSGTGSLVTEEKVAPPDLGEVSRGGGVVTPAPPLGLTPSAFLAPSQELVPSGGYSEPAEPGYGFNAAGRFFYNPYSGYFWVEYERFVLDEAKADGKAYINADGRLTVID